MLFSNLRISSKNNMYSRSDDVPAWHLTELEFRATFATNVLVFNPESFPEITFKPKGVRQEYLERDDNWIYAPRPAYTGKEQR